MSISTNHDILLLHHLLDRAALLLPQKTAILYDEGRISYVQLAQNSMKLAAWLQYRGCQRGDRIVLLLPNSVPLVTAIMAASRVGAIFVIMDILVKAYNLQYMLADAEPVLIITTRQYSELFQFEHHYSLLIVEDDWQRLLHNTLMFDRPTLISQDIACLIYTSGSTGRPKGVISKHSTMLFAAAAIQKALYYQENDIVGTFLPLAFDVGLYQILLCFQVGATLALGQPLDVGPGFLKKLHEWHITGLPGVPGLIALLARLSKRDNAQLPLLRFVTSTGAHLASTTIAEVQTRYPACLVYAMFGLTECKRVAILAPVDAIRKKGSVGKPLDDTECIIIDAQGQIAPAGTMGELVVRGQHVMAGYWRATELTEQRFRPWGPGYEHVLFTGDICMLDADGYLYFIGRNDDIYKQEDRRVSAQEIESAACDITGIHQAALIPPNRVRGAVLFVRGDTTSPELIQLELRKRLEDYKLPRQIITHIEIPLTPNGKVDRNRLRQWLNEEGHQP